MTSIFLLSDGLDGGAQERVADTLVSMNLNETFTINTFGFGADHDPILMNGISKLKDGTFYYVEKLDVVDECFVDALSGLFTVVAQNVNVTIKCPSNKVLSDVMISKT